jgi:hypothetical protein
MGRVPLEGFVGGTTGRAHAWYADPCVGEGPCGGEEALMGAKSHSRNAIPCADIIDAGIGGVLPSGVGRL